jgi:hypothetical protein
MAEVARPASLAGAGLEAGWLQTIFLMLWHRDGSTAAPLPFRVTRVILVVGRRLPVFPWKRTTSGLVVPKSAATGGHASSENPLRHYRVFSRLELTLHGLLALSLAANVVVLPLHTRH